MTHKITDELTYLFIYFLLQISILHFSFNHYIALPELNIQPRVINISGVSAEIEWDAWNNVTNVGDPPVVAYRYDG